MRKSRRLTILGLIILAVSTMLTSHFAKGAAGDEKMAHQHSEPTPHVHTAPFVCPMHSNVQQSSAGTCPICRMDLVQKRGMQKEVIMDHSSPKHSAMPATTPQITINADAQKAIALKTAEVVRRHLPSRIETIGKVTYNEDTVLDFVPRAEGWVDKLHIKHEGIRVKKGDKLLDFYSPEILVAQDGYVLSLKTNYSFSPERREYFDRIAQEKLRLYGMSTEMIREMSETGELKQTITLEAPQGGVITTLDVDQGDPVSVRDRFMVIADLTSVWIDASVYEHQLPLLASIKRVTINSSAMPGKTWQGKIDYIAASLDPKTNTLPVRLLVETPEELLKPNMQVDISLQGETSEAVLMVPNNALIPMERNKYHLVKANKNKSYQSVTVVPGRIGTHFTEILSGLEEGDEVVTSGQFLLDSESSLQANIGSMTHH